MMLKTREPIVIGVDSEDEAYIVIDRHGEQISEEVIAAEFECGNIWSSFIYFLAYETAEGKLLTEGI